MKHWNKPVAIRVFVPQDTAACSVGAHRVQAKLEACCGAELQIVKTGSRGMFWLEPLIEVETNEGRVGYGPVREEDVEGLVSSGLMDGNRDHELCVGLVDEIEFLARQDRLTFARVGIIDRLNLIEFEAHGGLAGLRRALSLQPSEILEQVTLSGLRGRGGAGFPTGIKWKTVHDQPGDEKYICVNADEGDSGTFADRMLMEGDPFSLLEGMIIAGRATGAEQGYIYIRSEYPAAIKTMNAAIEIFENAGWLGENIQGSGSNFGVLIRVGAGAYICGEETSMLNSLEGRRGEVRAKPPIPAISGLFGKPTIVNNVLTIATIPYILANGAEAYRDFGEGDSRGTQPFQLAGDVKQGGLIELGFGVTLDELVEEFGQGTFSGLKVKAAQIGGPLGGYLPTNAFDTPMTYEDLIANGAMLGHGGIVIQNERADMVKLATFAMEFCQIESCGKCTPCRVGSVRGKEVLKKIAGGENVEANLALLNDLCDLMEEASLCAMGGLTPMPVRTAIEHFGEEFNRQDSEGKGDATSQRD